MSLLTFTKPLYGKTIDILLDSDFFSFPPNQVDEVIETVYEEALRRQKVFNFFDTTSELSLLNKNRKAIVSDSLLHLITLGLQRTINTSGAYDITLGKQTLQRKKHLPLTPLHSSYTDVSITGNSIELLHEDVLIDLGSIAKGYIAERIAESLQQKGCGRGLIDARGDILAFGGYSELIGIQDPRDPEKEKGWFTLQNAGVATSGDYNQYDSDFSESHILHQGKYSSITVLAPTLTEADLFATILFVVNASQQQKILQQNPQLHVCTITHDNHIELVNNNDIYTILSN